MRWPRTLIVSIVLLAVLTGCGSAIPTHPPAPVSTFQTDSTPVPAAMIVASPAPTAAESTTANLAAAENGGRVVSASDELGCCPAGKLIDGYKLDGGEWWTSEPPAFPQTVVVELAGGRVWAIDHVVLNPWTSEWRYAWVKDFELYASMDNPDPEAMGLIGAFTLEHAGLDQTFSFDPVQARYVALVVTSHYGGAEGVTLNELEVYEAPAGTVGAAPPMPRPAVNLAAAANGGRIVDYSGQDSEGNWPPENLIDGQTDTAAGWSSDSTEGQQYVVIGLKEDRPYVVDRAVLNPYSERYQEDWIQEFELWGGLDSPELDSMSLLGTFRLEQQGENQTFTFPATEVRYLALVPLSNYGGSEYALNELEVYKAGTAIGDEAGNSAASAPDRSAAAPPEGAAASEVSVPAPTPPQPAGQPADFGTKTMVASRDAVDKIDYEIEQRDLVPVIYHLYGSYFEDLVITTLTNHNDGTVKVRVESQIPDYTGAAVDTVTIDPGETAEIAQNPPLTPQALDLLHSQKNASVHVRVDYIQQGEPRLVYEGTAPLTIYSRQDFPWNIPGYYNGTEFLAALVMPNDPSLDELMRVAADNIPGGIIKPGYGDELDSDHQVWDKMKAVYDAVSDYYNVIYVAVGTDFVPKEEKEQGFTLQRLKLPYEVLETRSGMCVELSTLFASAFEKMGLRPILITVPGHVYVAVPISWDSDTYYFLEGTLVGRATFEEAVQTGASEFMDEAKPYIEEDRLDDYFWVDVSEARQEEIWPIPWR